MQRLRENQNQLPPSLVTKGGGKILGSFGRGRESPASGRPGEVLLRDQTKPAAHHPISINSRQVTNSLKPALALPGILRVTSLKQAASSGHQAEKSEPGQLKSPSPPVRPHPQVAVRRQRVGRGENSDDDDGHLPVVAEYQEAGVRICPRDGSVIRGVGMARRNGNNNNPLPSRLLRRAQSVGNYYSSPASALLTPITNNNQRQEEGAIKDGALVLLGSAVDLSVNGMSSLPKKVPNNFIPAQPRPPSGRRGSDEQMRCGGHTTLMSLLASTPGNAKLAGGRLPMESASPQRLGGPMMLPKFLNRRGRLSLY
eukprot:scaffold82400_cov28-Prasinocladus_malaysianus.AAC.1